MGCEQVITELFQIMERFFKKNGRLFGEITEEVIQSLEAGGKILVFGNGGSAAQAQHFAAELVNRFLKERQALAAISLTTDTSSLTSIANDTSFIHIFSRQIEAIGKKGDVALALSTSGNSANVIQAIKKAREMNLLTVALTGKGGGKLRSLPEFLIDIPSSSTPRVQEAHLILLHLLAQEIEEKLSG
ncbi:MAG: SIS domain-containing protein [Candidatus Aminicenantales bacterium]